MHDDKERVFYQIYDKNEDSVPGKDDTIRIIFISKKGKIKAYNVTGNHVDPIMDDVVGKDINEIKKFAEEKANETYEIENVNAVVETDSSGNNTTSEAIPLLNEGHYMDFASLTDGRIRDKYYSGYIEFNRSFVNAPDILITEVSKGDSIFFDKVDGKIVTEKK